MNLHVSPATVLIELLQLPKFPLDDKKVQKYEQNM